jgi:hypothetical protein
VEEQTSQTTGEPGRRSTGVFRILVVFGGLVILYSLSVGPVGKLAEKGLISKNTVAFIYAPLVMLVNRSEAAKRFFDWYWDDVWKISP